MVGVGKTSFEYRIYLRNAKKRIMKSLWRQ